MQEEIYLKTQTTVVVNLLPSVVHELNINCALLMGTLLIMFVKIGLENVVKNEGQGYSICSGS